jgi:hypothetical protein
METVTKFFGNERNYFIVIFLAVTYLAFVGLTNNCLWNDEAWVGSLAKNFLRTGVTGYDERNMLDPHDFALNNNLEVINPPFEHLITAASFKLFGISTFSARLPYVLFGLGSVIAFWFLLRIEFESKVVRYYALASMAFSYSFLLNIRQCRYYAVAVFCSILAYYLYKKIIHGGGILYALIFTAVLLFFFNTHYLTGGVFILGLATVHLIFYRNVNKKTWALFAGSALLFLCVTAPHAISAQIWHRPESTGNEVPFVSRLILILYNFRELDLINYLPFCFIAVYLLMYFYFRKKNYFPSVSIQWLVFMVAYTVFLSFFSIQSMKWAGLLGNLADIRYLVVLIPFSAGFVAVVFYMVERGLGRGIAFLALVVFLCTNVFACNMAYPQFRFLFPAYLYEIHTNYTTSFESVIEYLRSHAAQDDIVVAEPVYKNQPINFYLGDKLRIGSLVKRDTHLPLEKLRQVKAFQFMDEYYPNWVIGFGTTSSCMEILNYFSRDKYTYQLQDRLNVYNTDMTRPELPWHSFKEPVILDSVNNNVYVFHRIDKPAGQ